MNRKKLPRWIEPTLNLIIPILAVIAVGLQQLFPSWFAPDISNQVIVALIAGLAITNLVAWYGSLREINSEISDIAENVQELSGEISPSAKALGVIDMFRRSDSDWPEVLAAEIEDTRSGLDLCGVAFPAIQNSKNKRLIEAIRKRSEEGDIRILLLDSGCSEAKRRSLLESPAENRTIADIKDLVSWIHQQQIENRRIRAHQYEVPPMLYLVLTETAAYVESYHFGTPKDHVGCIGGNVPVLKIAKEPNSSYHFYRAHFDYLWADTAGRRINLSIEKCTVGKPDGVLRLRNNTGRSIDLTGWSLSSEGSGKSFTFTEQLIWQDGQQIKISNLQNQDTVREIDCSGIYQHAPELTLKTDVLLMLNNKRGTLVWRGNM